MSIVGIIFNLTISLESNQHFFSAKLSLPSQTQKALPELRETWRQQHICPKTYARQLSFWLSSVSSVSLCPDKLVEPEGSHDSKSHSQERGNHNIPSHRSKRDETLSLHAHTVASYSCVTCEEWWEQNVKLMFFNQQHTLSVYCNVCSYEKPTGKDTQTGLCLKRGWTLLHSTLWGWPSSTSSRPTDCA